jgi:N-acetylmuramoyl-L-alanine amidase
LLTSACRDVQAGRGLGAASSSSAEPNAELPGRAAVVQRADELALHGAKLEGPEGAALTLKAARLRERVWRLEGREADALEASELYKSAAERTWLGACDPAIAQALLKGEVSRDPTQAYKGLYLARARHPGAACEKRANDALFALAAFAPLPDELAALDRQAAPAGSAPPPSPSAAPETIEGPVIVPKIQAGRPPARITNIEHYGGKDAARVVVFVTEPALFEAGSLPAESARGPRLFIDVSNTSYKGKWNLDAGGLVERVRLGRRNDGIRVVLDLAETVYRRVFYLPEPFRLVIDVSKERPKDVDPEREGPRDVRRVVLDPGHGGHDPGATGPAGLREKDVALDIAHRAAPLIARELNISTLLTRDGDVFVPLDERVARANAFGADLFVSIHCNASENPSSRGVTTFVLDASRDDLAARVAARENASSPAAAAELANVMSRVRDAASTTRSDHFAKLLQRSAIVSVGPRYDHLSDLGVRSGGFYVLAGARMPAVLFEASFISNPVEETRLDNGDYRQKLADAIVNAVRAYRDGV